MVKDETVPIATQGWRTKSAISERLSFRKRGKETETDRQTGRKRDRERQTERVRDRQTDIRKDKQPYREK